MITYSIIQKSQLEGATRLDAEYYQPEYLKYEAHLRYLNAIELIQVTNKIDVGFVSSMVSHFQEKGIPLLRTQNIQEFIIALDKDLVFIDEEFHQKLKKSQISPGQVLLARSGSIGAAALVPDNFQIANSADIILIETKDNLLPEFLTTYLNCKYGRFQIERASSGGLQGHINLYSLGQIRIPMFSSVLQFEIKKLVDAIIDEVEESKNYYKQAEQLLLQELGLEKFEQKDDLSFVVNLSDIQTTHRMDAEFFQPKYKELEARIKKHESRKLGELVSLIKGFEPGSEAYQENGKLFIRVSSLSKFGIENKDQKYLSTNLYDKLKKEFQPQVGEILLTKDATPGIAYVVKEPMQGIISGGIVRLKINSEIEPEYLALCINAIIGKMQAERDAEGSIIAHWKQEQIKNLLIPILPKEKQQQIAELVIKSHEARKKSKELLAGAKKKVEEMIEQ